MLRFLADENFNNIIVRGVLSRNPALDIVRIQDVGLIGADDPAILAWAAENSRIVLTHDVATMADFAYARLEVGLPMSGLFELPRAVSVGVAIEEILLLDTYSFEDEWAGQVRYLPL